MSAETATYSTVEAAPLADYTTFRLGGPCRRVIACPTPDVLQPVILDLIQTRTPYILIGGGSNLLVADRGVDAVVVRFFSDQPGITAGPDTVDVSGATLLDHLARWAVEAGLEGVNMCSGIPGTVGGAVIGNAGAFGRQIGDVLESVLLMDPQGTVSRCPAQDLELAYRRTRLQAGGEVVLSARLRLVPGDAVRLQAEREEILALRRAKHPDWRSEPCIGSIFRNIEPTSKAGRRQAAGWFLEQAGVKGMRVGGAFIYPKHANIIVRDPQGTASDVHDLSLRMAEAVQTRFGLRLEREVRFLGDFSDGSGGERPAVFH